LQEPKDHRPNDQSATTIIPSTALHGIVSKIKVIQSRLAAFSVINADIFATSFLTRSPSFCVMDYHFGMMLSEVPRKWGWKCVQVLKEVSTFDVGNAHAARLTGLPFDVFG
jgi:hypothetical protein